MRRPDFTPTLLVGFSGKLLGNYIELCASKHLLKSRQKIQVGELPFFGIRLLQCAVRSTGSSVQSLISSTERPPFQPKRILASPEPFDR